MPNHFNQNRLLPPTPKLIKYLIVTTLSFGCLSGFFNSALGAKLNLSFFKLFSLSFNGLQKGFFWQPFTFMFVPEIEGSLTFYFLFTLCFDISLLWFFGCKAQRALGLKKTLILFFAPALFATLVTTGLHFSFHISRPLFGLSFSMVPLVVAYCFSSPQVHFSLLPMRSIQAKWLALGLVLLYLVQDIANVNGAAFIAHLLLCTSTALYMKVFEKREPLFNSAGILNRLFNRRKQKNNSSKIINLYESCDSQEEFMNRTLDKIERGQKINFLERIRLKIYHFRKRNKV